jgi:hypothetical protein
LELRVGCRLGYSDGLDEVVRNNIHQKPWILEVEKFKNQSVFVGLYDDQSDTPMQIYGIGITPFGPLAHC